jgi:hypothetical protein
MHTENREDAAAYGDRRDFVTGENARNPVSPTS